MADNAKDHGASPAAARVFQGAEPMVIVPAKDVQGAAVDHEPTPDRPDSKKLDHTRPGGLTIRNDGKTVQDSEGRVVEGYTVKDGKIVEGKAPAKDEKAAK